MPTPPVLTTEQRRAAYEKALVVRRQRVLIKDNISLYGLPCLEKAFNVWDSAQGMKVMDLLLALPGVGKARAVALLKYAGIPEKNTVRACGPRQTERLFALLSQ